MTCHFDECNEEKSLGQDAFRDPSSLCSVGMTLMWKIRPVAPKGATCFFYIYMYVHVYAHVRARVNVKAERLKQKTEM